MRTWKKEKQEGGSRHGTSLGQNKAYVFSSRENEELPKSAWKGPGACIMWLIAQKWDAIVNFV